MKKVVVLVLLFTMVFAGGILQNSNQSAEYIRILNRNASLDLDAVFYNPAGLTHLNNGFHFAVNNQTIFQSREIVSVYPTLNHSTFEGKTKAIIFPDIYAAYKKGRWTVSGAIMPIGGGGSAEYSEGLPSFEIPVAQLVPILSPLGVTDYKADIQFNGSSVFLGGQLGISYRLNDVASLSVGARGIYAKNTYEGYLKNIQVKTGSAWMQPADILYGLADQLWDIDFESAVVYQAKGNVIKAQTADKEVDVMQTGFAFTPIIGLNLMPEKGMNIGLKYEHYTALELKTDMENWKDDSGTFPYGGKKQSDLPAIFSVGVSGNKSDKLRAEFDVTMYMHEKVDWEGKEADVKNGFEMGVGFEYALSSVLTASAGYLKSNCGATPNYQSDLSYSLDSNSFGGGVKYALNDSMIINAGMSVTKYDEGLCKSKITTFKKGTTAFGVGLQYSL